MPLEKLNIVTPRLNIRNLQEADLENFLFYRSNPEVTKFQGFDVMNRKEAKEFINSQCDKLFGKSGEWVQYAVEMHSTKQLIGDCAIKLNEEDIRIAQIGITITPTEQRKGLAKEALKGILHFLFRTKNVHRIEEIVAAENEASIQLLKSLGFKLEGHFRDSYFFNGAWRSEYQFAMLKIEWEQLNT